MKKLENEKFAGNYVEMIDFMFSWCSQMQNKINEIIDCLSSKENTEETK